MGREIVNYTLLGLRCRKLQLFRPLSPLERIFTVPTATMFTFGATIGGHLYLSLGHSAEYFGVFSALWYFVGGIVALAFASCYGELSSLAPSSGGVYSYCYNTMGEIYAFLVGWLLVLAHSFRLMVCTRSLAQFTKETFFDKLEEYSFETNTSFHHLEISSLVEECPVWEGLAVTLLVAGLASTGIKESIITNVVIVVIHIIAMTTLFVIYIFLVEGNYEFKKDFFTNETLHDVMLKGFGVIHDAYFGFQSTVYLGEEALDPAKTIPISLLSSVGLVMTCYTMLSFLHSLLSRRGFSSNHSGNIVKIMKLLGLSKGLPYFIGLGGVCGLAASGYASMFMLTRLLYCMSSDGLIFKMFSHVSNYTSTPVVSTFAVAFVLGIIQMFFKMSFIYILAKYLICIEYIFIPICLLITRYRCEIVPKFKEMGRRWVIFNAPVRVTNPTYLTETISEHLIAAIFLASYVLAFTLDLSFHQKHLIAVNIQLTTLLILTVLCVALSRQPQNDRGQLFHRTSGVPYVPIIVLFYSLFILIQFTLLVWLILSIWCVLGVVFYFSYSRNHSEEGGKILPDNPKERWSIMLTPKKIKSLTSSDEEE